MRYSIQINYYYYYYNYYGPNEINEKTFSLKQYVLATGPTSHN